MVAKVFPALWRQNAHVAAGLLFQFDSEADPVFLTEIATGQSFLELFGCRADVSCVNEFCILHVFLWFLV